MERLEPELGRVVSFRPYRRAAVLEHEPNDVVLGARVVPQVPRDGVRLRVPGRNRMELVGGQAGEALVERLVQPSEIDPERFEQRHIFSFVSERCVHLGRGWPERGGFRLRSTFCDLGRTTRDPPALRCSRSPLPNRVGPNREAQGSHKLSAWPGRSWICRCRSRTMSSPTRRGTGRGSSISGTRTRRRTWRSSFPDCARSSCPTARGGPSSGSG